MARPKDLGLEHTGRRRPRRQATSGLSIPAFCAREEVSTASFYAWRRRVAAPPPTARPAPPLFVPLHIDPRPEPTASALGFEIDLPHHIRLRCAAAPEPQWLGRLVAALAGLRSQEVAP
jgi:hypothetical protein